MSPTASACRRTCIGPIRFIWWSLPFVPRLTLPRPTRTSFRSCSRRARRRSDDSSIEPTMRRPGRRPAAAPAARGAAHDRILFGAPCRPQRAVRELRRRTRARGSARPGAGLRGRGRRCVAGAAVRPDLLDAARAGLGPRELVAQAGAELAVVRAGRAFRELTQVSIATARGWRERSKPYAAKATAFWWTRRATTSCSRRGAASWFW